MKCHAFLSNPGTPEKEFMASNSDQLREFIEAHWLNRDVPEDAWDRMLNHGHAIHFPTDGTIHIEVED